MRSYARDGKRRLEARMRLLNRAVLGGLAVFMPLYLLVRFTGGEGEKLQNMSEWFSRLKEPIVWRVPPDGVRYVNFYHGPPDEGNKFVLVDVEMEARLRIGFPVVPRCFRLVDDRDVRYYPLSRSPFFIAHGDSFHMDRDEVFAGTLLFEIPARRRAENLLFDRYAK